MNKTPVTKNGKTYHYILTVQDIFSRYLWLRPLTKKTSHQVARKLSKLYSEVGPPRVIQSDNGGEFKKSCRETLPNPWDQNNTRLTISSPVARKS